MDINITDISITPLKKHVADEYYDPAKWLMRKIRGSRNGTGTPGDGHPQADVRISG